jgi:hypothetical protein
MPMARFGREGGCPVQENDTRRIPTLLAETAPDDAFDVGTTVRVRGRYLGSSSGGLAVAEVMGDGYRLRRSSDDQVFPDVLAFDDVHPDRRQDPNRGTEGSHLDRRQFS